MCACVRMRRRRRAEVRRRDEAGGYVAGRGEAGRRRRHQARAKLKRVDTEIKAMHGHTIGAQEVEALKAFAESAMGIATFCVSRPSISTSTLTRFSSKAAPTSRSRRAIGYRSTAATVRGRHRARAITVLLQAAENSASPTAIAPSSPEKRRRLTVEQTGLVTAAPASAGREPSSNTVRPSSDGEISCSCRISSSKCASAPAAFHGANEAVQPFEPVDLLGVVHLARRSSARRSTPSESS